MSDLFFQFPLPLLSPRGSFKDTLQMIVSYCIVEMGKSRILGCDPEMMNSLVAEHSRPGKGFNAENQNHLRAVVGGHFLNATLGHVPSTIDRHADAEEIIGKAEQHFGKSARVFISTTLLWECYHGDGIGWREFSVLCGVNSVIGLKRTTPVRISRDMISARSRGYMRPADPAKATRLGLPVRAPLTTSELRTTLDRLEGKEFFVRVVASPRRTYFAKGVSREEARKAVLEIMQRKRKVAACRAEDRALFGVRKEKF